MSGWHMVVLVLFVPVLVLAGLLVVEYVRLARMQQARRERTIQKYPVRGCKW